MRARSQPFSEGQPGGEAIDDTGSGGEGNVLVHHGNELIDLLLLGAIRTLREHHIILSQKGFLAVALRFNITNINNGTRSVS